MTSFKLFEPHIITLINSYKIYLYKYEAKYGDMDVLLSQPQFSRLRILHASKRFTDAGLTHVPYLTALICDWNDNFTDTGLAHLPQLRTLYCGSWNNNFTDKGLAHLPHLTTLNCGPKNNFTDAGLAYLPHLTILLYNKNQSNFTDATLASIPYVYHWGFLEELD